MLNTPSPISLVSNPPSSTAISVNNLFRPFSDSEVNHTCIASNLGSSTCRSTTLNLIHNVKTFNNQNNSECVAFCPTNTTDTNYITYKKTGTGSNQRWGWNQTKIDLLPDNNTISILKIPINYVSPDGEPPVTCHFVNANSDNCKLMGNLAGCQAFCKPNDAPVESGFLIEQRCPSGQNSCKRTDLVWNRK